MYRPSTQGIGDLGGTKANILDRTQRDRTGSTSEKPLPFVRPAEIYRRMQEEKERQRQSQESSRPSIDAANPDIDNQQSTSNQSLPRDSQDNLHPGARGTVTGTPTAGEIEGRYHQAPHPAADSTSDLHTNGNIVNAQAPIQQQQIEASGVQSTSQEPPKSTTSTSLLPVLPEVTRMSAFGESFLSSANEHKLDATTASKG